MLNSKGYTKSISIWSDGSILAGMLSNWISSTTFYVSWGSPLRDDRNCIINIEDPNLLWNIILSPTPKFLTCWTRLLIFKPRKQITVQEIQAQPCLEQYCDLTYEPLFKKPFTF
ncbi:hypothetical protein A6R68_06373, partial [Neotoma lepida]